MIVLHESRATALRIKLYDPLPNPVPVPTADVFDAPAVKLCLSKEWVDVVAAVLERLAWEDAWEGSYTEVERATQNANELFAALYLNDDCDDKPKPWKGGGGGLLDCIELTSSKDGGLLDTINIKECDCNMPVYVNIYDGCGCGDGGKLPSGGGDGGGDGGDDISVTFPELGSGDDKKATVCDGAYYLAPYVIAQGLEFINQAKQFVDSGGLAIDFVSDIAVGLQIPGAIVDAVQEFGENLKNLTVADFQNVMTDVDFELKAQVAWVKTFGGASYQPDATRQNLREWARRLPIFWGSVLDGAVISPAAFFTMFSFFVDLQKVNGRKLLARGTSNSAFCEYVYSQAQVEPPSLPAPVDSLPVPLKVAESINSNFWVTGEYNLQNTFTAEGNNGNGFNVEIGAHPGIVGVYIYGDVFTAGGNIELRMYGGRPVGKESDALQTTEVILQSYTDGVQDRKIFVGTDTLSDTWQPGYDVKVATYYDTQTEDATLRFGFGGNYSTGTTTYVDAKMRLLIDANQEPFPA